MNKNVDFCEAILIFEHYLAPSIEWKIQAANRLCRDATEAKRTKEAAEALSKMNLE